MEEQACKHSDTVSISRNTEGTDVCPLRKGVLWEILLHIALS